MAGFLLFCIYKSLLQYSCFSLPWDRAICHARWRCAYRAYRFCRQGEAAIRHIFWRAKQRTPHLTVRGSSYLMPGSSLLSHGETPHYHRRYGVSLLSSAWGQVGPPRYSRQANSCALSCVFWADTALAALVKSVTYLSMLLPFLRLPPCLSAKSFGL